MIQLFRKLFKKSHPKTKLWKVVNGHEVRYWEDINDVPQSRIISAMVGLDKIGLGIRPADSRAFLKVLRSELKNYYLEVKDVDSDESLREQNIYALLSHYESQLSNFYGRRLMAEIGGYTILVDDEPLNELSHKHNKIKEELLHSDEVFAFFLSNTVELVRQLRDDINIDSIKNSMTPQNRYLEQTFFQKIGLPSFENLWREKIDN